ncbi:sentrin-specific protease 2 isoform X2 [Thalassophryne amazonica]|uniref:sentrin-specific protease 2 isoform X2 n=1 Tax=Thalassophryne amazonica TaxID=390379 RepID=UPI001471759C|nr:sentrin-specific protease 2 isoform X2 [Thalassophryne amazonica]
MYGWIRDGISSLFEPVTGQNPTEWPGKGNGRESLTPTRRVQRPESHCRPAKRTYQSVDSVCQSEQVEVKRRRRDVVISFVKKTVTGVASLLRLRNPLTTSSEEHRQYEETQPVTLMGIDELHSSWMNSADWRMDKPVGGVTEGEKGGKNPYQSSLPPLMRRYRADRERQGSIQLLPSRPAVRLGTTNFDPACSSSGHNRCHKPSLTVEEAIKQNNKEHYRRLLEMVTEKYSKSQPLPFNQAKPQEDILQTEHRTKVPGSVFESSSTKMGHAAAPSMFTWRHPSSTKDRRSGLIFTKTCSGAFEDTPHVRNPKQAAELDLSAEVATRLSLAERETPAITLVDTHSAHVRHSDEDIPRLTKEMAAEVSCALAQSDPNLVLSAAFKLCITRRDLSTLQEGGWLNDEVMNFYLSLVMERCSGETPGLKVYSFSTFFLPKLQGGSGGQPGGHSAVKRWTKTVDIFLYDLILVPLHLGVHWAITVIDVKLRTVKSYDSMGQRHDDICSLLLLYLKEEHRAKKGRELDSAKWTVGSMKASEIPQQKNGSDCGVFACKYAEYIAKGKPLTFKQCHMPLFRKLIIWEILNQKLL